MSCFFPRSKVCFKRKRQWVLWRGEGLLFEAWEIFE